MILVRRLEEIMVSCNRQHRSIPAVVDMLVSLEKNAPHRHIPTYPTSFWRTISPLSPVCLPYDSLDVYIHHFRNWDGNPLSFAPPQPVYLIDRIGWLSFVANQICEPKSCGRKGKRNSYLHESQVFQTILNVFLYFAIFGFLLMFSKGIFRPPQSIFPEVIVRELRRLP